MIWKAYPRHGVNLSPGCYSAVYSVLKRREIIAGPEVAEFENAFARYIGVRHAVGVSSGRAALYVALRALDFQPGDEIIMPAYTFHIVPLVIEAYGLRPVFVDVLPGTYNIDISKIEALITPRTKAILATHMYGQPCEIQPVLEMAAAHNLKVLEDCAHALGADYGNQKAGSLGDLGLFTFAMAKNMPCFGGGMLTTNDPAIHEKLRSIVRPPDTNRLKGLLKEVAGTTVNYVATLPLIFSLGAYPVIRILTQLGGSLDREPGQESVSPEDVQNTYPTRITNLQAAVGCRQLKRIDTINRKLNDNATRYSDRLGDVRAISLPSVSKGRSHTFLYYRILVSHRQTLREALIKKGVDTMPDDMSDCTQLPPFRHIAHDLKVAPTLSHSLLEIPNNPHLKPKDVDYIATCIKEAVEP